MSEQSNQISPEEEQQSNAQTSDASDDDQTPIEASRRKTGSGGQTDAKPTAVQESGSSDPLVEGGGNQGTEKR
ncbi:hypothetical protein [Microcoleus sp. FACHB-672]|uniref:hypothetical protein n=1 Tax=Microcoleus sp. FACHB-672 TaxID=2692825 RepID=UPI00168456E2|nr:hypothetical protein [Microcoleus sp. FACHB-672]MBD2041559.1 hypothetical protein [Microcoleus sp. FACHB-672]